MPDVPPWPPSHQRCRPQMQPSLVSGQSLCDSPSFGVNQDIIIRQAVRLLQLSDVVAVA